jgi:hypothetical protein
MKRLASAAAAKQAPRLSQRRALSTWTGRMDTSWTSAVACMRFTSLATTPFQKPGPPIRVGDGIEERADRRPRKSRPLPRRFSPKASRDRCGPPPGLDGDPKVGGRGVHGQPQAVVRERQRIHLWHELPRCPATTPGHMDAGKPQRIAALPEPFQEAREDDLPFTADAQIGAEIGQGCIGEHAVACAAPVTCAAENLPLSAAFDAQTGQFTWTPLAPLARRGVGGEGSCDTF